MLCSCYQYVKFKCFEENINANAKCSLYQHRFSYLCNALFWLIGLLLCYTTIIIFYIEPSLFDIVGKPQVDIGFYLIIPLVIALFVLLLTSSFAQTPLIFLWTDYDQLDQIHYDIMRNQMFCLSAMYILSIILSNISTILAFHYITTQLYILIIPVCAMAIVSSLMCIMYVINFCCKNTSTPLEKI